MVQYHPRDGGLLLFHSNLNKWTLNVPTRWAAYRRRLTEVEGEEQRVRLAEEQAQAHRRRVELLGPRPQPLAGPPARLLALRELAAKELGLSRVGLRNKIERLGLERPPGKRGRPAKSS